MPIFVYGGVQYDTEAPDYVKPSDVPYRHNLVLQIPANIDLLRRRLAEYLAKDPPCRRLFFAPCMERVGWTFWGTTLSDSHIEVPKSYHGSEVWELGAWQYGFCCRFADSQDSDVGALRAMKSGFPPVSYRKLLRQYDPDALYQLILGMG